MKFSKDKKKSKIEKRMWDLIIKISKIKSSGRCELCGKDGEQRDHCFSASKCSKLRFDHRNITNLCGRCHTSKSFQIGGFEKIVDAIVKRREGMETWNDMLEKAKPDALYKWNITMLEQQEIKLKEFYSTLLQEKGELIENS